MSEETKAITPAEARALAKDMAAFAEYGFRTDGVPGIQGAVRSLCNTVESLAAQVEQQAEHLARFRALIPRAEAWVAGEDVSTVDLIRDLAEEAAR